MAYLQQDPVDDLETGTSFFGENERGEGEKREPHTHTRLSKFWDLKFGFGSFMPGN